MTAPNYRSRAVLAVAVVLIASFASTVGLSRVPQHADVACITIICRLEAASGPVMLSGAIKLLLARVALARLAETSPTSPAVSQI